MRMTLLIGAIILAAVAIAHALDFARFVDAPLALGEDGLEYEVPAGASLRAVAADLGERGVLSKPLYWRVLARVQDKAHRIKSGEYRLEPGLTPTGLLDLLVAGKTIQYSLTLVEGWSFKQVMGAIAEHPELVQTLDSEPPEAIMAALGAPGMHPEGWFYPDTYLFPSGTTDLQFLRRTYETMQRRLAAEWEARSQGLPLESPYEALILASIVEKETGAPDERGLIAAVFLRRLERGMRLQTDPTVIYGMGERYQGNIRKSDLLRDTPYNTYTRKGLPPTPIAMPGGDSIHAVLHPAESEALYFVATGDGRHHFSQTYEEHRQAVIDYQLGGKASRYKGSR
ncbi:MAG: endolytic transglycosylase MltG [Chromatiales bacterium]